MNKAMMADAIATCTGAALGTSTVTTFVESSAGVAAGDVYKRQLHISCRFIL